jgi:hypothetical protein
MDGTSVSKVTIGGQLGLSTGVFVTLHGFIFGPPIVTAVRFWLSGEHRWDDSLTAFCEHCRQRFEPEPTACFT